ncbi:DUF6929 family protein [Pedobacter punctiformis]|uniref:Uncharacterized protein n=1 Tax=Pedobacter punctiformis TaxID=3004097 RepID=A0ABT4LBP7_9SPHI|nr:hypothetical protein [Pedobacter sp. HCMS5-2]MCZ4245329.1 hypothetical protein [Pedobacter sp. HCMS5-2]
MHKTGLNIFAEIDGIGAASGLFVKDDLLYIIGDNSGYLNQYDIKTTALSKIQILSSTDSTLLENIPKTQKPDFEVLCHFENTLFILGSGSTPVRNLIIEYDLETNKITSNDLSETYNLLKPASSIDDENFNIEGAIFTGEEWLLFNRGNGSSSQNGIFKIPEKRLTHAKSSNFYPIILPNIKHINSSFTDATFYKDDIYFISTAEDTNSTFNDGEILGSFIGSINAKSLKLNFAHKISGNHKFEGISFYKTSGNSIEFLLCEDLDTEELKTTIYKLTLSL